MKSITFIATLESDVIVTANAATTGPHQCLDYLPGSNFLGAAAARFYNTWLREEKSRHWPLNVFHRGKVRFGDAFPVSESGYPCLPAPLSWHFAKDQSWKDEETGEPILENIHNLAVDSWSEVAPEYQPSQIREGYFSGKGGYLAQFHHYRMKTSIDSDPDSHGRSSDGQLFGFSSIPAGSRFYATLRISDDLDPDCVNELKEFFADNTLRIGRSRENEYGRVRIQSVAEPIPEICPATGSPPPNSLLIYAAGDISLENHQGVPSVFPTDGTWIHQDLEGASLDLSRSFIRTRLYSPWNGHRRSHDLERHVIGKGSVLCYSFEDNPPIDIPGLTAKIQDEGVGNFLSEGLGQVLINPAFLTGKPNANPLSLERIADEVTLKPDVKAPDHIPAFNRMRERSRESDLQQMSGHLSREWTRQWKRFRSLPSASQWGRIRKIATNHSVSFELNMLLGELGSVKSGKGIFGKGRSSRQWKDSFSGKDLGQSIVNKLHGDDAKTELWEALKETGIEFSSEKDKDETANQLAILTLRQSAALMAADRAGTNN